MHCSFTSTVLLICSTLILKKHFCLFNYDEKQILLESYIPNAQITYTEAQILPKWIISKYDMCCMSYGKGEFQTGATFNRCSTVLHVTRNVPELPFLNYHTYHTSMNPLSPPHPKFILLLFFFLPLVLLFKIEINNSI